MREQEASRTLYAGLELLDRQLVDRNGWLVGKVDDLELEMVEGDLPVVTAVLSGCGTLTHRFGGRFGRRLMSLQDRPRPGGQAEQARARIPFGVVTRIEDHVELDLDRASLATDEGERWARALIGGIPGADHAPE